MEHKISMGPIRIIGIQVRTSNANGQSGKDLKQLWDRFYEEGIMDKIPHKTSNDIYAIYTDYESDYRGAYTAILGCPSIRTDSIPEGLVVRTIDDGTYIPFHVKGKMPEIVINTWKTIWSMEDELKRAYTADFEIYGAESRDMENAKVSIYVSTK